MRYYLATNKTSVFHYGKLAPAATVQTGQPFLFYYATKADLISAMAEYNQILAEPVHKNDLI